MRFFSALILALSLLSVASAHALHGENLLSGKEMTIAPGKKGTVVVFLSARCPCSKSHAGTIKALAEEFKDFTFVAVHSNPDEARSEAVAYFSGLSLPFPVLQDRDVHIADELRASRTPYAFVLSTSGATLYKGGVSNSTEASEAQHHYLKEALLDLKADRSVRVAETRSLGCVISRRVHAK